MNTEPGTSEMKFSKVLFQRINDYFAESGLSKKADQRMILKIIAGFSWLVLSYAALFLVPLRFWQFLVIYMLHGLAQVFILLNISHDANHQAISKSKSVNNFLSYTFELCGISSYMWRILHHRGHHSCMNVYGEDEAILAHGMFRLSPHCPWKKMYRFQHLYAFILYGVVSLDFVLVKDFYYFFFSGYRHTKGRNHPFREYVLLFTSKIVYLGYMIVLPVFLLEFSIGQILIAFLAAHFIMGFITTLVFQTSHVIETSRFPGSSEEFEHYVFHIFATTADYSVRSSLAYWFFGGLHLHIAHHLCPNVCHTHYPALTEIARSTAEEFGIEYRENRTMYGALIKHFHLLKQLGKPPLMIKPSLQY